MKTALESSPRPGWLRPEWPAPVGSALESTVTELQRVLGSRCLSVILYGGLAKGEFVLERSDVNLMVVVDQVTLELLDQVAPLLQRSTDSVRLSVLLLSEDDLRRSTDVFPIKFLDIQRYHQVLAGRDVVAGLTIARHHLRLRCEQELKNLLLRLRQFYLERSRRPEMLETTLTRAVSSLLINLGVLAELKTGVLSPTKLVALENAGKLGLQTEPVRQVLALKRGELKPEAAGLKELYASFMFTVEKAARMADELEEGS